jgi:oligoribonuclease (3'-5' exoribonuclease)
MCRTVFFLNLMLLVRVSFVKKRLTYLIIVMMSLYALFCVSFFVSWKSHRALDDILESIEELRYVV